MSLASFGVKHPVPVNLLMIAIIVAGVVFGVGLRREFFPEADPDQAFVTMPYPGATPEEVEEGLALKVEDALDDLDEVKELRTTLAEGGGGITIEFQEGINIDEAMDEVDRAIDSLTDLPDEAEEIQVELFEPRLPVIRLNVFGELDEEVMKRAIRDVRDDLRQLPGMGEVLISGVRNYEIRVDIRREDMLKHGVSLPEVAAAIRNWMTEVPGGTVRSQAGNVKVRTMGVAERAAAIEGIVLRADPQGRAVHVRDIGTVEETFVDDEVITRFNNEPAAGLTVFKVGDQDIVKMAEMVRAYVAGRRGEPFESTAVERVMLLMQQGEAKRAAKEGEAPKFKQQTDQRMAIPRLMAWELGANSVRPLPSGASIATNSDLSRFVEGRLDLLLRNAMAGGVLVVITLLVFLHWRAAFWVGMGLMTAIMGTLVMMAAFDVTLNLLTMFGLIVVLGLLVDDAIVVAENIQTHHERGDPALNAAVTGTHEVMWPVVATVLTSIVAFLPMTMIEGRIGTLMGALPAVVACALSMSLIESILILPSHMGHTLLKQEKRKFGEGVSKKLHRVAQWRERLVHKWIVPTYGRMLAASLKFRYISVAAAVAFVLLSVGLVLPWPNGRVKYDFLPGSDAESIVVDVRLPIGSPISATDRVAKRIEAAAWAQPEVSSVETVVGQRTNIETGSAEASSPHVAQLYIELVYVEERDRESSAIINSIRDELEGEIDEIDRINYLEMTGGPIGTGITLRVQGENNERVQLAVEAVKDRLWDFDDVRGVYDDNDLGQLELRITLKPGAATLGFTPLNIAQQVRAHLFGIDAHVYAAEQEDIDVRVRLDEQSRRSLATIENGWVVSPAGRPVPLTEIADIEDSTTYSTIKRIDGERAVTITADTIPGVSPESIVAKLELDTLRAQFPNTSIELGGRQEREMEAFRSLPKGFMAAIIGIYVILAWLFSHYIQPLIVMSAIPFAVVGAIWGHFVLGYDITFLSIIGFVALSGIVVNDSLIYVGFFNERRARGLSVFDALVEAGKGRVRAILLTTITTVLGLTPLILEQSFQAKFLIPMAITIAAGLMGATMIVLLVLPCFLLIGDDLHKLYHHLWHGRPRPAAAYAPPEHVEEAEAAVSAQR